jgi:hypothetical protein
LNSEQTMWIHIKHHRHLFSNGHKRQHGYVTHIRRPRHPTKFNNTPKRKWKLDGLDFRPSRTLN